MKIDVAIIGAGVVGALIARELSAYDLKIALLERCNDVAMGASKANSGIIHAGFDAMPGTLKAQLNLRGCAVMEQVCKELAVPYKNNGSLVVAFSPEEMKTLQSLYERGLKNGVPGMSIIDKTQLRALEPNISESAEGALLADTAAIVCPYELTIGATENAVTNGAVFVRNCAVQSIDFTNGCFQLTTTAGPIEATYVVNAAGCFADRVSAMIGDDSVKLVIRRGAYYILDKAVGNLVSHTIFQCPSAMGKGILVAPTVDGNLLIGPTAENIEDPDDTATTTDGLSDVRVLSMRSVPSVSTRYAITSFSGNRSHDVSDDFILGPSKVNAQFIQAAGIESPGLSSSPAIAEYVRDCIVKATGAEKKADYNPIRSHKFRFRHATDAQREEAIAENPAYGRIICRCETVTEGEIVDAIQAPAGARDVDGVKRRTRAGMGRCQSGFCGSKVVEILARELGVPENEVTKFGGNSTILYERTK